MRKWNWTTLSQFDDRLMQFHFKLAQGIIKCFGKTSDSILKDWGSKYSLKNGSFPHDRKKKFWPALVSYFIMQEMSLAFIIGGCFYHFQFVSIMNG